MRLARLFTVLGILALLAGPVQAQQGPDTSDVAFEVRLPDSVVVTATRVAAEARTTGRKVSVYTQRDIEALSVNSVDQLLDVVGGVDVQSRGGFGVQSDLKMRGSTFNGVLLLLDGARLNDPYTGHFLMDLPVPLSEIARVLCRPLEHGAGVAKVLSTNSGTSAPWATSAISSNGGVTSDGLATVSQWT